MSTPIRIYLIDDHPAIIDGLKTALTEADDMVVVGTSTNEKEGLEYVLAHLNDIDVLITDFEMPDIPGNKVCASVKEKSDRVKVIFYTAYHSPLVLETCRKAKADGFIYKNAGYNEIRSVIRDMYIGKKMLLASEQNRLSTNFPRVDLTPTEITIVKLIGCKCMTTKQAAEYLSRSTHTVETHRKNIMEALEIHTVQELVHFAINAGYCTDT